MVNFSELVGKTISAVNVLTDICINVQTSDGKKYEMIYVDIKSIVGDINDLVGHKIISAEVVSDVNSEKTDELAIASRYTDPCREDEDYHDEWTFYKLVFEHPLADSVTILFVGTLNGSYSLAVDFRNRLLISYSI